MAIALCVSCTDTRGVDRRFHAGARNVFVIQLHAPGDFCKLAFDVRDHHVANLELRRGMSGIDLPSRDFRYRRWAASHFRFSLELQNHVMIPDPAAIPRNLGYPPVLST